MANARAFTLTASGIGRVIQGPISVCTGFDPQTTPPHEQPAMCDFNAIWDTGATASVITQAVVDKCGLKPTGMIQVHGVHGTDVAETYAVNIGLPNLVRFKMLTVTKGKLVGGAEALIGMDIITAGDFSISNYNGRTIMSFRVPSIEDRDFVKDLNAANASQHSKNLRGFTGMSGGNQKGRRHKGRR
jgi:hypothetical protein